MPLEEISREENKEEEDIDQGGRMISCCHGRFLLT